MPILIFKECHARETHSAPFGWKEYHNIFAVGCVARLTKQLGPHPHIVLLKLRLLLNAEA